MVAHGLLDWRNGAADYLSPTVLCSSHGVQGHTFSLFLGLATRTPVLRHLHVEPLPPGMHMALYSHEGPFLTMHAQVAPSLKSLAPYYALFFFINPHLDLP